MARATGSQPEYPLTLSDGVTTIGLRTPSNTAIRRLPRTVGVERKTVRQNNWTGGRGNDRFATDTARFADSGNLWSMVTENAISGPLMNFFTGASSIGQLNAPGGASTLVFGITDEVAARVIPASNITVHRLYLPMPELGVSYTVKIYSDTAGTPNTALWTGTQTSTALNIGSQPYVVFDPNLALTGGTTYWVGITAALGKTIYVDVQSAAAYHTSSIWVVTTGAPLFHIGAVTNADVIRMNFFEYKRQLYCAPQFRDGTASLLVNGDRGMATGTQSTSTLKDTTQAWNTNEWAGCVVYIYNGTNAGEYRTIASNTADTLTLASNWPTACTVGAGGTVYVILGSSKWTAISGHGFPAACTSVAVLNNIVYFAFGDAQNMHRMQEVDAAGVWTRSFAADGTNKATYLLAAPNYSTSVMAIYKANRDTSTVATAPKVSWGTDLTFATAIECGGLESRINSIVFYDNAVHTLKDDSVWRLGSSGTFGKVDITLDTARDERNGVAVAQFNKNLYFSFMDGLERLFGTTIDDIGPNRDEGMPASRRGAITSLRAVVQYLFAAYNGGSSRYSSILATSSPGGDWHSIFIAPEIGMVIGEVFYQTVPGVTNRLWFDYGGYIAYLVMPDDTHSPLNDSNMTYALRGYIASAWIDFDTPELQHFFQYLRVLVKTLTGGSLAVYYQTEADETNWTTMGTVSTGGSIQQLTVGNSSVTGSKIRFALVYSSDTVHPIVLKWYELRANQINEALYDVLIDLEFSDVVMMMDGADSRARVTDVLTALEAWKLSASPLTVRCAIPQMTGLLDNVRCNIDPFSVLTAEWHEDNVVLQGNLQLKIV